MKIRLISGLVLASLSFQVVQAQDIRPQLADLTRDWTNLSPRVQCLDRGGLKDQGLDTYSLKKAEDLDYSPASIKSFSDQLIQGRYNPGWEVSAYLNNVINLYRFAGEIAASPKPDKRRLEFIFEVGRTAPIPDVAKSGRYNFDLHLALITRECAEEYFAAAFGIGAKQGLARYEKARSLWSDDPLKWPRGFKQDYYPRQLVAFNYLVTRELLLEGRVEEAFALTQDPVMQWAVKNHRYATNFVASFYQLGIGTPRSLPKALAVFQSGESKLDIVAAASIKASLGQKAAAITDLQRVLKEEWSGDPSYIGANALYTQLTGSRYVEPPKPGFIDLVVMIPLAVLSYCATLPNGCATGQSGGDDSSSRESILDHNLRVSKESSDFVQTWNDWTSIGKPDY